MSETAIWTPADGTPEIRSIALDRFLTSDDDYVGGSNGRTAAEIRITPETALQSTVVLACCRILAETIASMPIHVMRRTPGGGKEVANDIPLYKVLSFAPNEWQTKFEFFEQMVMNLTLWGNSYSAIRSGKYGAVSSLDNLHPSRMEVERLENGRLRYSYTDPETGRPQMYTQDQIMHVRWTARPDGIKGMVPVEIAREAIALARACEIHASKYWANSARPGIVLQTDGTLSPEAAERLRDNWERLHRGVDRAYKTCVLTSGLKVEQIGFNQEQSQFIDSRRFQSEEIGRVYRIPGHLYQGQSGGNLEIAGREFVTYTLVPWMRRIESAISRSLIYNDDMFVAEFDPNSLMRGDSNSRAGFYSTMTGLGIYSVNDCRRAEGLPPIENGDRHFVAMNTQTLEDAVKPKPDPMAMMMGGGPPPPAQGGVPSLPEVKKGEAPAPAEKGQPSEKKPDTEQRKLSSLNQALYDAQEKVVADNGRWPKDGPGGAHYMESNPFSSRGVACKNCVYYEGGACEIVKGSISPEAVCKLWIIPEEKLSLAESRGDDCGRADAGKFGYGNDCAGTDTQSAPAANTSMPKGKPDDPRNTTSWLNTSGDFHPIDRVKSPMDRLNSPSGFNTHDDWARKYGAEGGERELERSGWVRVTHGGKTLYANNDSGIPPKPKQIAALRDFAISHGTFDEVVFDPGGGRKAKVLWAKSGDRTFCPTGDGGGIDNSCGDEEGGAASPDRPKESSGCPEPCGSDDVQSDSNKDGVTDAARVGVPAFDVPPPPGIPHIPNLEPNQRAAEKSFMSHFESDPDKVSSQFRDLVVAQGGVPTFGTDDAKCLTDAWSHPDASTRAKNRATLNTALHQTANAIAKRAFVQHLDTLKEGDEVLVTVGGCGAGKGFALKNVPEALEVKSRAAVVWDSAGDQNGTESPWVLEEATKRGLKVNYVYVHADPFTQWADPNRGVVKRASDPKDGRMVDARVFADSYAVGAKNHDAFFQANKDNKSASFVFLDNTGPPKRVPGVPKSALGLDADELAAFAEREVEKSQAPTHVKTGALAGKKIWKGKKAAK